MAEDRPGYSFSAEAPPEVAGFLRAKSLRPAFSWQDVEPEEHAVAFSVAKAMQVDVLEDIRAAVQTAIDDGQTFAQFQADLRPRLEARGWWGRADMTDPDTGEARDVQLGSPRRLRTIYRANLRSARAAGQWDRIERAKAGLPYLIYQLGPSERHRPHHVAKEGLVLPVDDAFWSEWMPPNGWGCKCHVRQITRAEAERRGIAEAPERRTVDHVNDRTGQVREVPVGIDPGWDVNPGRERARNAADWLQGRLDAPAETYAAERFRAAAARAAAEDVTGSWRFRRAFETPAREGERPADAVPLPVAVLEPRWIDALNAAGRTLSVTDRLARAGAQRWSMPAEAYAGLTSRLQGAPVLRGTDGELTFVLLDEAAPRLLRVRRGADGRAGIADAAPASASDALHDALDGGGAEVLRGREALDAWRARTPRGVVYD